MIRRTPPRYIRGNHWVTDDHSGFRVRVDNTVKEWTGLRVWERTEELRNPQDFIKVPKEKIAADIIRQEQDIILDPTAGAFSLGFTYGFKV